MSNMQERFKRAFDYLDKESKLWSENDLHLVLEEGLNLMWLRNEARLWEDYVEDESWLIGGIQYDPNHPDNLSSAVFELWKNIQNNSDLRGE